MQEIERAVDAVDIVFAQLENLAQDILHVAWAAVLDFQAHRIAAGPLAQFVLDGAQQIFRLFLVDIEVAVARNAEAINLLHFQPGKEVVDMVLNQILDEDVVPFIAFRMRNAHQSRQDARNGHDRVQRFRRALRPFQAQEKIMAFVLQLREGVAGIHGQRRQHREDFFAEVVGRPSLILLAQALEIVKVDAMLAQFRKQDIVPKLILVVDHVQHDFADRVEGLARRHPVGTGAVRLMLDLLLQPGHAHLEKFIEIGGYDSQKTDPFQQRLTGVLRFFQHAAVEGEPAEFTVDEKAAIGQVGRGHGG